MISDPGSIRKICGIFWLAIFGVLALNSIPTKAEQNSKKPFVCVHTKLALEYECRPQGEFLGAAVGMSAKAAFDGLCTHASNALWSAHATSTEKPSGLSLGLDCGLWPRFANSRIWQLRLNGYPCVRTRFILILLADQKIGEYSVWCHDIADKSLLVDDEFLPIIPKP